MRLLTALVLAAAVSGGSALAASNTMTAAPAAKPAAAKPAPTTPKAGPVKTATAKAATPAKPVIADPEKKAISKACSDQANAKNLHGKAREKFRNECKHNGGKA